MNRVNLLTLISWIFLIAGWIFFFNKSYVPAMFIFLTSVAFSTTSLILRRKEKLKKFEE